MPQPTKTQKKILSRFVRGTSPKQIALEVGCTYATVRNHLSQLCKRCDITPQGRERRIALGLLWKSLRAPSVQIADYSDEDPMLQ